MGNKHTGEPHGLQPGSNGNSAIWAFDHLERQAIELLNRFEQRSGPGNGVHSATIGDTVIGYYAAPEARMDVFRILVLGLAYLALARELRSATPPILSVEDADQSLYAAFFGARCVTTAQYLTSDAF